MGPVRRAGRPRANGRGDAYSAGSEFAGAGAAEAARGAGERIPGCARCGAGQPADGVQPVVLAAAVAGGVVGALLAAVAVRDGAAGPVHDGQPADRGGAGREARAGSGGGGYFSARCAMAGAAGGGGGTGRAGAEGGSEGGELGMRGREFWRWSIGGRRRCWSLGTGGVYSPRRRGECGGSAEKGSGRGARRRWVPGRHGGLEPGGAGRDRLAIGRRVAPGRGSKRAGFLRLGGGMGLRARLGVREFGAGGGGGRRDGWLRNEANFGVGAFG